MTDGLLISDGCFAQVFKGPLHTVENAFERIQCDARPLVEGTLTGAFSGHSSAQEGGGVRERRAHVSLTLPWSFDPGIGFNRSKINM